MKQTDISKKIKSLILCSRRDHMIEAGAYDGRFRNRVILDKRFRKPRHTEKFI